MGSREFYSSPLTRNHRQVNNETFHKGTGTEQSSSNVRVLPSDPRGLTSTTSPAPRDSRPDPDKSMTPKDGVLVWKDRRDENTTASDVTGSPGVLTPPADGVAVRRSEPGLGSETKGKGSLHCSAPPLGPSSFLGGSPKALGLESGPF